MRNISGAKFTVSNLYENDCALSQGKESVKYVYMPMKLLCSMCLHEKYWPLFMDSRNRVHDKLLFITRLIFSNANDHLFSSLGR